MLVLAVLTFIAIRVQHPGRFSASGVSQRFTLLAAFGALAVYVLLLVGSQVTASGAALVYPDWPLFGGAILPSLSPDASIAALQATQFIHRLLAALVGLVVLAVAWVAWRPYADGTWGAPGAQPALVRLTGLAVLLYAVQIVVGALQIWTLLSSWAVALHVALGAAIWALLVAAAAHAYCEARSAQAVVAPGSAGPAPVGASKELGEI
jgi:heme A synthase